MAMLFSMAALISPALPAAQAQNPPTSPADASQFELKQRYQQLTAATNSGDPERIASASRMLSAVALRQLGDLRMLAGSYALASDRYQKSLECDDASVTRRRLAVALLRAGKVPESLTESGALLAANASDFSAWFLKGKAEMAKDDYGAAVKSFEQGLRIRSDVNVEYALGVSFLRLGEIARAQEVFGKMLGEYGDRAIWHVVFGGAYRETKRPDDAVREFRRAIAMDPSVGHAYFFLGLTLLEQNHWAQTEESIAAFRGAVQQDPEDYFANFYLGVGESELKLLDSSDLHLKVAAKSQPDTPEIYLYLGLNAFQGGDQPTASENLRKAIALTGSDEARNNYQIRRAYITLGRIEFVRGNRHGADEYIRHAKELQNKALDNSAMTITETLQAGGMQQVETTLPYLKPPRQSGPDEAAPSNTSASMEGESFPDLTPAQRVEAQKSETELRQILSSGLNDWGAAEARQGHYIGALQHFQEAEHWDNATPGLMRNLGLAALRAGNIEEAIRGLSRAVEVDPQDSVARGRLALTLFRVDQYEEAQRQFSALGEEARKDPMLAYAWGYTLTRLNQLQEARSTLAPALDLATTPDLLLSIGDLFSLLESYEQAVRAYRKALQLNPDTARARYKMGAALLRLDRPADAVAPLEEELRITPGDPDVQYNLAYALLQTSQKDRALQMLRSLVAAHPEHPQAQYELGKTLLEDGNVEEAIKFLEAAVRLDPTQEYIHYQLQAAYRRSGQRAEADRELEIYRTLKARKREKAVIAMPEQVHE